MFIDFKKVIQSKLDFLLENSVTLYQADINGDELWELYLSSFPAGTDPIYRKRTQHDCSCCRQFIRNYGNIVGIIDNEFVSIWDVVVDYGIFTQAIDNPYQVVANNLNYAVSKAPIKSKFFTKFPNLGTDNSKERMEDHIHTWEHFYYELPLEYVTDSNKSVETLQSHSNGTYIVIKRSCEEFSIKTVATVIELIEENLLYRGKEHLDRLLEFNKALTAYNLADNKTAILWEITELMGRKVAIRNTAIGTLLINLTKGMSVEDAADAFGKTMEGYKRPKAIFTQRQKDEAIKTVTELGLMESLPRTHAQLEDLNINDVLWVSNTAKEVVKTPFDALVPNTAPVKNFNWAKSVDMPFFINEVLPNCKKLKVLFSDTSNLMTLTKPVNTNAPSLLKWDNGFAWSYVGNNTDAITQSVIAKGGQTDAPLRFSISWADNPDDNSDLDAHCMSTYEHISYRNRRGLYGNLDVDIQRPKAHTKDIVENIVITKLHNTLYDCFVQNFELRGNQQGFKAVVAFDNKLYKFHYNAPVKYKQRISVASIYHNNGEWELQAHLPYDKTSETVWGIQTEQFIEVDTVMLSPNHWGNNKEGNKHYLFVLNGCKNPDTVRGFYNEFLRNDLTNHRRVFEALGKQMKIQYNDNQMSGVGFSSTINKTITVKVDGKPLNIEI